MRIEVLLLALVACKRDDNGTIGRLPDAEVTVISEGQGPENAAPLEPARIGYHTATDLSWQRWTGAIDAGRDDVVAKEISGGNQPMAPTIGQGVGLYRATDDGLVLHALDSPLDDETLPVLMVPNTVRVGMVWESEYGDGTVNRMQVVGHENVTLPIGSADVWGIAEFGDAGGGYTFVKTTRWYAEGIGRVGTGINETEWSPVFGYTAMVVPAEDQAHDEPALAPVELVNVLAIEPHGETGHEIWGLSGAVIDGTLWAYMDGEDPAWGYSRAVTHDYCASLASPPLWSTVGHPGCPTHVVRIPNSYSYGSFYEVTVLIDNAAVILPGVEATLDLGPDGGVSGSVLTGWVVDGVVETLEYSAGGIARYHRDIDNPLPTLLGNGISTASVYASGGYRQVWLGPARVEAGATIHFAVINSDGQVFRVTLADDELTGFLPVGVLPGAVSVMLDGDERSAASITTDGRVFALRVDQTTGDVTIDALGSVRVEEPGGAYEFKGVLLDPTSPGDVYVAAIATSAASVPFYETGLFRAHLEAEPRPLVSAATFGVGASQLMGGLAVCWPPSDEPFDGEGWTVRGAPVRVTGPVGPHDNCAFLDFDNQVPPDPLWVGAEQAITAKIPGVGAVDLGYSTNRGGGLSLFSDPAVLPDGRLIDVKGAVFDADGFPITYKYTDWDGSARDIGGYGLWAWTPGDTQYTDITNIGGGIAPPPCPSTVIWATCYYLGPVVGGGMLMMSPAPSTLVQVVRPDGTIEDLPLAQTGEVRVGILLADGRFCGLRGEGIVCADASGAITTTGPLPGQVRGMKDQWWPLSDGSLLVANDPDYGPSLRFDPTTMTASVLDARGLQAPVTSADGHVYAVAHQVDRATTTLVEVTPTGVIDLADLGGIETVLPVNGAFLVGPGSRRIPRP